MLSRILSYSTLFLVSVVIQLPAQQLPGPIPGRPLHKDSVKPPLITKLRGEIKQYDAHPNVHPAVPQSSRPLLPYLTMVTIGEGGIPGPRSEKAGFAKTRVRYPAAIKLGDMSSRSDAIYDIRTLSEDEGLSVSAIVSILEDSRGHIWLGTHSSAVYRLDGEHVQCFSTESGFPLSGGIASMIEDRYGRIWFSGIGGVCYFDGHYFNHFARTNDPKQADTNGAGGIIEDQQGKIWFVYGDLYCFEGDRFEIYPRDPTFLYTAPKTQNAFSHHQIGLLGEDRHGNLWISVRDQGVRRFDGKQVVYITEEDGLVDNNIGEMKESSTGELWFASGGQGHVGKGITRFTPGADDLTFVSGTLTNYNAAGGLSDNRIAQIIEDREGNLWFSTYRGGISIYDGDSFTHISQQEGLVHNSVLGLIIGRDNVLWAGTNNGRGLNQILPYGFRHFSDAQGYMGSTPTGSWSEDQAGNIWFGKAYDGVIKYDGGSFYHIGAGNGLPTNWITDVMSSQSGDLWIGTRDNGCIRYDGKQFTHYNIQQGLSYPQVWDILEDSEGMIWLSLSSHNHQIGVNKIDPKTSLITVFQGDHEFENGIGGCLIYQDKDGIIWLGGNEHIAKYDSEGDRIEYVAHIDSPEEPWPDHILEDDAGNLWLGTAKKFIQVKDQGVLIEGDFPQMSKGIHWPEIYISRITMDQAGRIWILGRSNGLFCLEAGLSQMTTGSSDWLNLTKDDGLKGNRSNQISILEIDSKNRLWTNPGTNGATFLDLNEFEFPKNSPASIGLIDLEIGGKGIDYGSLLTDSADHRLAASFDSIATFSNIPFDPIFSYRDNYLTFHYSATDWTAAHAIRYSYMLEGFDEVWTPATEETKAVYRNIPAGNYSFMVKAIGQGGIWSDPYTYAFSIRPPWWMTWWAYALYALLIAGSIGGYVARLRRKVRLKQEQLEREQYLNRELRELNIATTRFVPKDFVKILNKESLKELQLGDQVDATMTILFADIRGYTKLSESMTPEENFKFINAYVGRMGPIIQAHRGFICQYYGDGMMALFKDDHQKAIEAAIAMQRSLEEYNKVRLATDRQPFKIGIGINTGHLMLGVIGDKHRYDTSVLSDAVNTASRLEGLTKIFGSQIIVSEKTLKEIKDLDQHTDGTDYLGSFRFLGRVKVKGKDQTLKVYEVFDGELETVKERKRKTAPEFEQAIEYYFHRKFGKAADILKEILEKAPDDVAAQYYLDRSVQFIVNGVEEDWSGVEEMVSK